jgi:hypothetical protein
MMLITSLETDAANNGHPRVTGWEEKEALEHIRKGIINYTSA